MEVLFIILPLAIVMAGIALAAFYWGVHGGQFDDMDTPRYRLLFDDPVVPSASRGLSAGASRQAEIIGGGIRNKS